MAGPTFPKIGTPNSDTRTFCEISSATSLELLYYVPTNQAPTEHGPQSHGVQKRPALTLSSMAAHKRALSKIP